MAKNQNNVPFHPTNLSSNWCIQEDNYKKAGALTAAEKKDAADKNKFEKRVTQQTLCSLCNEPPAAYFLTPLTCFYHEFAIYTLLWICTCWKSALLFLLFSSQEEEGGRPSLKLKVVMSEIRKKKQATESSLLASAADNKEPAHQETPSPSKPGALKWGGITPLSSLLRIPTIHRVCWDICSCATTCDHEHVRDYDIVLTLFCFISSVGHSRKNL